MINFGETFRRAREAKGLTTSDIAKMTNMLEQQVQALEREDFSNIAAPIYGRGFVRLYCEALGIEDSRPLVNEFMDIYTGNKPPTIRKRILPQAIQPPAIREDEPQSASSADEKQPPKINIEETVAVEQDSNPPETQSVVTESADEIGDTTAATDDLFSYNPDIAKAKLKESTPETNKSLAKKSPSRYSVPHPIEDDDEEESFSLPPIVWRVGLLLLIVGVLIFLLFSGIRAIYHVSMSTSSSGMPETTTKAEASAPAEPQKRTPFKIPALYID